MNLGNRKNNYVRWLQWNSLTFSTSQEATLNMKSPRLNNQHPLAIFNGTMSRNTKVRNENSLVQNSEHILPGPCTIRKRAEM